MRVFCIPYAGGSEDVFDGWPEHLAPVAEVRAALLPGRGARFGEPLLDAMPALVEELARQVGDADGEPLVLLGHSFGALAAHALALHLEASGRAVARLVVSGSRAPFLPPQLPLLHTMSDAELTARVGDLGGTDPEVLAHRDLMAMFLPILRADFRIVETYAPGRVRLACPMTVMGGRHDAIVPIPDLEQWRAVSRGETVLRLYEGDHFFIDSQKPRVARAVRADLVRDPMASAGDRPAA
ncbi:thioesterase II family protein [Salinarimonas chemoclinalis]|uniref:thioesterase II family protein n=1 Tax=Salinarimonas chemoclinalis TaxID=3241599 RepID=UPI003556E97D